MQVSIFSNVFSGPPQETSIESIVSVVKSSGKLYELTSKVRVYLQSDEKKKADKVKKGALSLSTKIIRRKIRNLSKLRSALAPNLTSHDLVLIERTVNEALAIVERRYGVMEIQVIEKEKRPL